MTMSGRRKKIMLSPGRAIWRAAGACRQNSNGIAFRLLEKALWIHCAGFQLQTSPRKHLLREGQMQSKKTKREYLPDYWIMVTSALSVITFIPDNGASCIWLWLTWPRWHMNWAVDDPEVAFWQMLWFRNGSPQFSEPELLLASFPASD